MRQWLSAAGRSPRMAARAGVAFVALVLLLLAVSAALYADSLPSRLQDSEFWKLVGDLSEPDGTFRSDNLLSNELRHQQVIPGLLALVKPGRVYLGVGPEQNFTYIAALKPSMAFIVDVRRGNLDLQLMYKALFELSRDRNEFVSRLFSRPLQAELNRDAPASAILSAYKSLPGTDALYLANLRAIETELTVRHGFALSPDDVEGLEYAYHAFFMFGPDLQYSSTSGGAATSQPSYAQLMTATDLAGQAHGFLSSEAAFQALKDFEGRNLLVPIVGNFGGPKAIRAVGAYVRARGSQVSAFYLSNVEQYLYEDGELWNAFCANLATLPIDDTSTFIHALSGRPWSGFVPRLGPMAREIESCRVN